METQYRLGRGIASTCVGFGYAFGALAILSGALSIKDGGAVQVFWGILCPVLNHGLWQTVKALFDIADNSREQMSLQRETMEAIGSGLKGPTETVRRQPAPAPTPGEVWAPQIGQEAIPTPVERPVGMRPGETEQQWAKRIEREEAEAFKRRADAK